MKIKLKNKDNPVRQLWCFMYTGYESSIIDKINSGKQVEVDKVPKPAWEFVEKIENKKKKKKESK
tara:strand:- start:7710 stop:7904 length:195 start_codon:yes stop_codon:yes gene_type:complete